MEQGLRGQVHTELLQGLFPLQAAVRQGYHKIVTLRDNIPDLYILNDRSMQQHLTNDKNKHTFGL
jgi:hypothetical protein